MHAFSRRDFGASALGGLLTWSLLDCLSMTDAFGAEMKSSAAAWLTGMNDLSKDLKGQKLTQTDWQKQIEALCQKVELQDVLKLIDFEKLTAGLKFRDQGELSLRPRMPAVEGLPTELVFGYQVFALEKDRSVVPHGHNNMATAFLILQGDFQGRSYDRIEDDGDYMIIKPTVDRPFQAGESSTVSDQKDNVHWFQATSKTAFIFNIHVLNIDPASKNRTGRVYVDPKGEKLADGKIRAERLGAAEAFKRYG